MSTQAENTHPTPFPVVSALTFNDDYRKVPTAEAFADLLARVERCERWIDAANAAATRP